MGILNKFVLINYAVEYSLRKHQGSALHYTIKQDPKISHYELHLGKREHALSQHHATPITIFLPYCYWFKH